MNRQECRQAKATIRDLLANREPLGMFPSDALQHVYFCPSCQNSIEASIADGSSSYRGSLEETLSFARTARPPVSPENPYYGC